MECSHGFADSDSQPLNGLCIPLVPFLSLVCIVDLSYVYALWGKTTRRRQGCVCVCGGGGGGGVLVECGESKAMQ